MTKKQQIIDYFIKHPTADVKKVAAKFGAAMPTIYTLRKQAMKAAQEANAADMLGPQVDEVAPDSSHNPTDHPLYPVLLAAISQAMFGKGERHGGAVTPFTDQPWAHYSKMHGRGFLTGQAAKKLEEAASTRTGAAFEQEVLGAIVYCGMAILRERAVQ